MCNAIKWSLTAAYLLLLARSRIRRELQLGCLWLVEQNFFGFVDARRQIC